MSRALLRRLEAVEAALGTTTRPVIIRLLSLADASRERAESSVRMVQIDPDGAHRILIVGPAPAGGGGSGRVKRRRRNGRGRGG